MQLTKNQKFEGGQSSEAANNQVIFNINDIHSLNDKAQPQNVINTGRELDDIYTDLFKTNLNNPQEKKKTSPESRKSDLKEGGEWSKLKKQNENDDYFQ